MLSLYISLSLVVGEDRQRHRRALILGAMPCWFDSLAMYHEPSQPLSPFQVLLATGHDAAREPEVQPLGSLYFCDSCSKIVSAKGSAGGCRLLLLPALLGEHALK